MGSVRHFRDGIPLKKVPIREPAIPLPAPSQSPSADADHDKRYQAIFHAAAMGIVQCTLDGQVVESNAAMVRMLGYTHEELRGMYFRDFTHPDDVGIDSAFFQEMVEGKRESNEIELRYLRQDRALRWVRLTVSLVRSPDGKPEFAIAVS